MAHDHQSRFSDNLNHEEFYTEAEESLSRAFLENHSIENAMIELKTLRMATNVTFHEVREAILAALMNVIITIPSNIKKEFSKWGQLLEKFTEDDDAKMDVVLIVQRYFAKNVREGRTEARAFVMGLQALFQVDAAEEDVIFRWLEDKRAKGVAEKWGEDMLALRNSTEKFVTWLREAEEESDE